MNPHETENKVGNNHSVVIRSARKHESWSKVTVFPSAQAPIHVNVPEETEKRRGYKESEPKDLKQIHKTLVLVVAVQQVYGIESTKESDRLSHGVLEGVSQVRHSLASVTVSTEALHQSNPKWKEAQKWHQDSFVPR